MNAIIQTQATAESEIVAGLVAAFGRATEEYQKIYPPGFDEDDLNLLCNMQADAAVAYLGEWNSALVNDREFHKKCCEFLWNPDYGTEAYPLDWVGTMTRTALKLFRYARDNCVAK